MQIRRFIGVGDMIEDVKKELAQIQDTLVKLWDSL